MKKLTVVQIMLLAALVVASGFNATSAGNSLALKFSHPREITNAYLPLASLKQDILESNGERVERTAKPDTHKTFTIAGQTVEALAVEDREYRERQAGRSHAGLFRASRRRHGLLPRRRRGRIQKRQGRWPFRRVVIWQGDQRSPAS